MVRKVLLIVTLTAATLAVRMVPATPAEAGVCDVPVIGTACNVVSTVYNGATWTLNKGTGAVSLGGQLVGKIITAGSNIASNASSAASSFVCDKLTVRFTTNVCNWIIKRLGAKIGKKVTSTPSTTTSAPSSTTPTPANGAAGSSTPSDSPQSYLRTSAIAAGAAAAVGSVAHAVSRGTTADVEASWFQGLYGRAAEYAAAVALLALLCALAEGGIRGDGALVMEAFRAVPYAAVLTFAASSIIALGIAVVDDAGQFIAGSSLHDATRVLYVLAGLFVALGLAAKTGAPAGHPAIARIAAFPAAMFSIFGVVGAGLVALELLLREVAIYVGALFLPLALAARIWPRLGHAATRLGHTLLAVITSKLVLVGALGLGASAILHGGGTGLLTGAGVLLVAGLAPGLLYGFLALTEHRFHRGALPAVSPTTATDRMTQIIGWQTDRSDRTRGAYYEARPDLQSPIDRDGSAPPRSPDPPTPPPTPRNATDAPGARPDPSPENQSENDDE